LKAHTAHADGNRFTLQQRKTVRVLQRLNQATVTQQEYGQRLSRLEPKTSAWKRRE